MRTDTQSPRQAPRQTARIAIVGAGLSGLYAAYSLERHGVRDCVLIEAREAPGGRIAAVSPSMAAAGASDGRDRFDLGATWFWPGYQHEVQRLADELGLASFAQFETGDMMIERGGTEAPLRVRGYASEPPSMRLLGGMSALTDALQRRLDATRLVTGQAVRRLHRNGTHVDVESEDAAGNVRAWRVEHVLLAVPPRLAEASMAFSPALPPELARQWRATSTWMAPHAKYVAVYDAPFWREHGLSGEARSARGPLGEIHDASMPGGSAALFGFFGVPASVRQTVPDDVLRTHCRAQLVRLFGEQAATPKAEAIKDWSQDRCTATAADREAMAQHAAAPETTAATGVWRGCLTGIASEWSPPFPGYVAGALDAASHGVRGLLA